MSHRKKEDIEQDKVVADKKEIKYATIKCQFCESESVKKVKDTDVGALYSCGCGNRFQK